MRHVTVEEKYVAYVCTMFGMLSGPFAVLIFMFHSNFATPGVAMVMWVIEEYVCLLTFGISPSFGLVKTELNWCRSISAFCLLSFSKISFFRRGEMPTLSCFFTFNKSPEWFGIVLGKTFFNGVVYIISLSLFEGFLGFFGGIYSLTSFLSF